MRADTARLGLRTVAQAWPPRPDRPRPWDHRPRYPSSWTQRPIGRQHPMRGLDKRPRGWRHTGLVSWPQWGHGGARTPRAVASPAIGRSERWPPKLGSTSGTRAAILWFTGCEPGEMKSHQVRPPPEGRVAIPTPPYVPEKQCITPPDHLGHPLLGRIEGPVGVRSSRQVDTNRLTQIPSHRAAGAEAAQTWT